MKTKQKVYLVVTIIIFVTTLWVIYKFGTQTNNFLCEYAYVEKVYDGDTVYTDKLGKIRLIGIDAPEIYHPGWTKVKPYKFYGCGIQSKGFAEKYLKHKNILFCKDPIWDNKWSYGRLLRYAMIFTGNTKVPFGYLSIQHWCAKVYTKAQFTRKSKYLEAEQQAKQKHIWIWSEKCILEDKKFKETYLKK